MPGLFIFCMQHIHILTGGHLFNIRKIAVETGTGSKAAHEHQFLHRKVFLQSGLFLKILQTMEIDKVSKAGKAIVMKSFIEPVLIRIQVIQQVLQCILRIGKTITRTICHNER